MPTVLLGDRALIDVQGLDAEHFLQNLITCDLDQLRPGHVKPGALLTPQGKILFDFLVSRSDDGLVLDCRADVADDLLRRLTLYKLRAKVTIAKRDQVLVAVSWDSESIGLVDLRFPAEAGVVRTHGGQTADAERDAWDALRIHHAVAESGSDFALGEAFPHDVLLDQNGGVGFRKGCYVGQEVVSRMQHRGTARRRVLIANGTGELPAFGTEISAGGRPIGSLGTVLGHVGLAIVRIDRVKDALDAGTPILAGGVEIRLAIPSWATFTFPQDVEAESA